MKKSTSTKKYGGPEKGQTITIFDVAHKAGVSIATVSRALGNDDLLSRAVKARNRILAAAESLGYTPNFSAQSLRQGHSNLIAVAGWFNRRSFTSMETLMGIHERLSETKYAIYLMECHDDYRKDEKIFNDFARRNFVCGIILMTHQVRKMSIDLLRKSKIPIILTEYIYPHVDNFTVDNFKGGYLAMRHLIDQGCRNIAIIAGWVDVPHLHNRLLGCEKALREADLLSRGQFLINSRYGFYEEGRRAAKRILNRKSEIDGVFSAAGDRVAIGAINYFKERGRKVPENIRVVGFDDVPESAYFDPPLTTVHQPIFKLGFKAADYLVRTLEGKRPGVENTVLEPKLIIRKSG